MRLAATGPTATVAGSRWDSQTAPVGSFAPNGWGLYDMHGNVWEWVQDCYNNNYEGAPTDGSAWESGHCFMRMVRGGDWSYPPEYLRTASRLAFNPSFRLAELGFRVVRTITP